MHIQYPELIDPNLYEVIIGCKIRNRKSGLLEIIVTYENGVEERIWTYKASKYTFNYLDFIGMTKIEAVFYCDRMTANR